MAYIKRNVNLFLLFFIIILLGIMGAITIYFQTTYRSLSYDYQTKLNELNQINSNLSDQKAQLNSISSELALKTQTNQKFDALYQNVTDQNLRMSLELNQTLAELFQTQSDLKDTQATLNDVNSQLNTTQGALATQLNFTSDLQNQVQTLQAQVCSLKVKLNESC